MPGAMLAKFQEHTVRGFYEDSVSSLAGEVSGGAATEELETTAAAEIATSGGSAVRFLAPTPPAPPNTNAPNNRRRGDSVAKISPGNCNRNFFHPPSRVGP